jgi:hypothetical protein
MASRNASGAFEPKRPSRRRYRGDRAERGRRTGYQDRPAVLGARDAGKLLNEAKFDNCMNIRPWHGITSTPVIDRKSNTIYACGITQPTLKQAYSVWALDLATGKVRRGWPIAPHRATWQPSKEKLSLEHIR